MCAKFSSQQTNLTGVGAFNFLSRSNDLDRSVVRPAFELIVKMRVAEMSAAARIDDHFDLYGIFEFRNKTKHGAGVDGIGVGRIIRTARKTDRALRFEEVPAFLRKQFTSKQGELGNFVIIYPLNSLSDGRQSMAFSDDVGTIETVDGTLHHAGSTALVAADMLKLMRSEAPWMVLATLLIVAALMYLNFTTLRWTLLALLPLIIGVLWMLLLVELFGAALNFYNLIVLPAVLGIGNDAGVHLVHRYREEGKGSIRRVLRSTGEHV
ncbi:MAG: hypothetical protein EBT52_09080, partial [Flavobacteriia bacterium]|nr:hypothetical protein [Flavobacteriia bacterium]